MKTELLFEGGFKGWSGRLIPGEIEVVKTSQGGSIYNGPLNE